MTQDDKVLWTSICDFAINEGHGGCRGSSSRRHLHFQVLGVDYRERDQSENCGKNVVCLHESVFQNAVWKLRLREGSGLERGAQLMDACDGSSTRQLG